MPCGCNIIFAKIASHGLKLYSVEYSCFPEGWRWGVTAGRRRGGRSSGAQALEWGLLLGMGLVCAVLGVSAAFGWFDVRGLHAVPGVNVPSDFMRWSYFARQAGWQVIQSLWEVAFLCSLALGLLRRVPPLPLAALGASLVFGLTHLWNPHATLPTGLNVAVVVGLPTCAVYAWARSSWAGSGFTSRGIWCWGRCLE